MRIMTINDLQNASPEDVLQVRQKISLQSDLYNYRKWLEESQTLLDITVTLGGKKRAYGVHPSSISKVGVCPLKIYYEITGEVESCSTFVHDLQDTFDIGTSYHSIIQTMFHDMYGDQFQSEVRMNLLELLMTGDTDGLFTFTDYRSVLEIKTVKEAKGRYGFEAMTKRPFPDHVRQATCYMKMLDVPFAIIWYFCKNNSMKFEHVITFDPMIWEDIYNTAYPIVVAAKNGVKVEANPGFSCRFCNFEHGCSARRNINDDKNSRKPWGQARTIR